MTDRLTITRPDDWHLHVRDGAVLQHTVPATARVMGRAIIMPNLQPPVMNAEQALEYRDRILSRVPQGLTFNPLMVLYLTDNTTPEMIAEAKAAGNIVAVKLYPAGATTNSASGVTDLGKLDDIAAALAENGMPLLVHGEVTQNHIDIFDREKEFLDTILAPLVSRHPTLKVVVEHITTKDAAEFVQSQGSNVAATITVQHLAYNRNHMLVGGIKPHFYCLPILKRNIHQQALQDVVASGNSKFFLGTDSAPHAKGAKENACGCAGCFTAYAAIELYAEIFEDLGALDKLEGFASHYGPDFYGLARNSDEITLIKQDWQAPVELPFGSDVIVPLRAGETLRWKLEY
ncbi:MULTISPECIES: dihydroorotase [unclassified Thalassolituus]|jgi:dihydroorotase|uniref:dihydroorotase n=1 Tax=Oceanospirillaceae TaxID=135620 RepID=UPI0011974DE9|nr:MULTISPECIES: dihydroorotase [unclassified Thalassolituus]MBU2037651.1 dihydroorotase [Gammaproteobacteria bacterium]TVV43208.1 dihydroorotase [Thalassolituus sp. C2-1]